MVEVVGWHEGSSTLNSSQHTERPSAKAPARSCQPARNSRRHSEEAEKNSDEDDWTDLHLFPSHPRAPDQPILLPTFPPYCILLPLSQASLAGRSVSFTPTYLPTVLATVSFLTFQGSLNDLRHPTTRPVGSGSRPILTRTQYTQRGSLFPYRVHTHTISSVRCFSSSRPLYANPRSLAGLLCRPSRSNPCTFLTLSRYVCMR